MVSFWPFKGGDTNSAAGFEKILSSLSDKINKASAKEAKLRQSQRRLRVLWTLYTGFAYVVAALILTLVTGRENWDATEYTGLAGGPVVIYGVRLGINTYFNYRLSNIQGYLNGLQRQREETIEKLKAATKYNSTQQLLEKYGGAPPKPSQQQQAGKRKASGQRKPPDSLGGRTGIAPPPTANIVSRQRQGPPIDSPDGTRPQTSQRPEGRIQSRMIDAPTSEEFAPNAFSHSAPPAPSAPPAYAPDTHAHTHWMDRILDLVMGEDETQPKNRIVLICQNCRLVNGQAPPGSGSLEELGKWRCMSCGAMNGVESEASKMIREMSEVPNSPTSPSSIVSAGTHYDPRPESSKEDIEDLEEDDELIEEDAGDAEDHSEAVINDKDGATGEKSPADSTRSKARQRRKG